MNDSVYCFVAGKSAGHIRPALHIAYNQYRDASYLAYISTNTQLDQRLIDSAEYIDEHVMYAVEGRSSYRIIRMMQQMLYCCIALMRSIRVLQRLFPDRVVSTGGLISVPVCCAAWLLHIPIDLYELNAVPGTAAYYISMIADTTYVCFPGAQAYFSKRAHVEKAAYPLSSNMYTDMTQQQARTYLNIPEDMCVVLILGGSQGSRYINTLLHDCAAQLGHNRYYILHQTGYHAVSAVQDAYEGHNIRAHVFAFRDDMHIIYQAADCCIARAGAGTLFEIAHYKKPAYIIPLELNSTNHQCDNAYAIANMYPEMFWVRRQHAVSVHDVVAFIEQAYAHRQAHTQQPPLGDQEQPVHQS